MHDFDKQWNSFQDAARFHKNLHKQELWQAARNNNGTISEKKPLAQKQYTSGRLNALRTIAWFLEGTYPTAMDIRVLLELMRLQSFLCKSRRKI